MDYKYQINEWETDILAHMYCRFANHIQLLIIFIYFIIIRALPILALVTDLQFVTQFNIKIKQAFEYIDKFHGYLHAFTNNKLSLCPPSVFYFKTSFSIFANLTPAFSIWVLDMFEAVVSYSGVSLIGVVLFSASQCGVFVLRL